MQHRPGPFAKADPDTLAPIADNRDPRYDNQPPLPERVVMEFVDDVTRVPEGGEKSLAKRIEELVAAAERAPACDNEAAAGRLGDWCKMARHAEKAVEEAKERQNRQLIDSRNALSAKVSNLLAPLQKADKEIRSRLNAWTQKEAERVAAERRAAEAEAERLREEARRNESIPGETLVDIKPRKVDAPTARGDLGATVGTVTVWHHEIESVRQVPDRFLKHPSVVEALDKVLAREIKSCSGKIEIKGVKIWSTQEARVR